MDCRMTPSWPEAPVGTVNRGELVTPPGDRTAADAGIDGEIPGANDPARPTRPPVYGALPTVVVPPAYGRAHPESEPPAPTVPVALAVVRLPVAPPSLLAVDCAPPVPS